MSNQTVSADVASILDSLALACAGHSQYTAAAVVAAIKGHMSQGLLVDQDPATVKAAVLQFQEDRWGDASPEWMKELQNIEL